MTQRLFLIFFLLPIIAISQPEARLLRFPAIHGNQVVFSYAGDLYTMQLTDTIARKLTSDIGYEMFARFSPDGKQIAFDGQYDGNTEVYTIPAKGGIPQRITYSATLSRDDVGDRMGPNNIVMTWTRDSRHIIYRSREHSFCDFIGQLYSIAADGGMPEQLPLPTGGFCSWSPDGKKLAYNRVFREFRTWKHYQGGMADDIWIYDTATRQVSNITNNTAQDIIPMWIGKEIYFLSDRDRTMNLFVYNTETKETKKVTNFTNFDIKFPSADEHSIIFENEGYLYIFDIKKQEAKKLTVHISDDLPYGRDIIKDASKQVTLVELSPDGKRVAVSARGDIFSVPAHEGVTRNLTQTSGTHEREAYWSPDGKTIAYLSDKSGEYEIWLQHPDGSSEPTQLTKNGDTYKYDLCWSPDSKKILWDDKMNRLQMIDVASKQVIPVETDDVGEFTNYSFSPDNKWIVYSRPEQNQYQKIWLYQVSSGKKYAVTDDWYDASNPIFSSDGKYIVFVSKRDFNAIYSDVEFNIAYKDMAKIYIVPLSKNTPSPFAQKNDEVESSETSARKTDTTSVVRVDPEGLADRAVALPVNPSNYWNLYCNGSYVWYLTRDHNSNASVAKVFDLAQKKESELASNISFKISANWKKMLISKGDPRYSIIDLPFSKINDDGMIDLSGMKVNVNLHEEWKQIYDECWRMMRDFFYVSNMNGIDWKAMHDKYAVLIPYVNHRSDLNYIIGEMIAELNSSHAYIGGGEKPAKEKIYTGMLGADISKNASGYFRIDKIYQGNAWSAALRSPLAEPGTDIKEGTFIISVNGISCKKLKNIYEALVNTADQKVELTVNTTASEAGSRKVIITPLADESELYYYDWVESNIKKVETATNGEAGYIHIPDMLDEGLNEFMKHFFPQLNRKALIIDDRYNGGGNVSPIIVERLRRELTRAGEQRNLKEPYTVPKQMQLGPKILLINHYSASDGDLFAYSFRQHNIGKIIGTRSWGGVVGIRGPLPLIDGADLRRPEFAAYSGEKSEWIIEGHGVEPDIEIENDPAKEYLGEDQQLNKAIELIKEELKNYKGLPPIPPAPNRSK